MCGKRDRSSYSTSYRNKFSPTLSDIHSISYRNTPTLSDMYVPVFSGILRKYLLLLVIHEGAGHIWNSVQKENDMR